MPAVIYAPNVLQPFQVALPNGTVLGAGTDVNLDAIRGLRSLAGVRSGDVARGQTDGMFPGYNLLGGRVVQIDWRIVRPSGTIEQALAELTAGWQNIIDPGGVVLRAGDYLRQQAGQGPTLPVQALQVQLPNRTYPLLVFGRPTKLDVPIDTAYQWGNMAVPSEFTCTDGVLYDSNVVTGQCGLPNPTSGLTFNATPNFTFGASSGGSFTLNNTGSYPTMPYFTITGPCTNPTIVNPSTGQWIKLNTTLGGSDTVGIDTQYGTVTLNGSANRNNLVDPTSTLNFPMAPGSNTVQFTSTDSAQVSGTLTGYMLPAYSTV